MFFPRSSNTTALELVKLDLSHVPVADLVRPVVAAAGARLR